MLEICGTILLMFQNTEVSLKKKVNSLYLEYGYLRVLANTKKIVLIDFLFLFTFQLLLS